MITKLALGGLVCMLLAGCATPMTRLIVRSVPEGATILQNGTPVGTTPAVFTYKTQAAFRTGKCFTVAPLTARWVSGAYRSWHGKLCPSVGTNQTYTFERPIGAPNESADNAFAAKLQLLHAQQAVSQAQAAALANAQTRANNEAALLDAAGSLGGALGCAAAGGCRAPYYAPPAYVVPGAAPLPPATTPSVRCTTTKGPFDQIQTVCH